MDEVSLKIVIRCADLGASRAFYADVLGLSVVDEWQEAHGDGCVFAVGSSAIELGQARDDDDAREQHKIDVVIGVPHLDAWTARIDGKWQHGEIKVHPWGERTVRMRDPDGVLLTLYESTAESS